MSEDLLCSLVEVYNEFAAQNLTLEMSKSAAQSLAYIYDVGTALSLQTAMYKIFGVVITENRPGKMLTFKLRFYREDVYFHYVVVAGQTKTGVDIQMLINDDKKLRT
ncbi:MAG: hypothetical protein H9535_10845 [Ignavibacteria bacterium]|nr:hypothetical protein [Ignavibacteria bacterium]